MSSKTDILVLGATGFTGRLIVRYLSQHPQRNAFTFAIGARSPAKVKAVLQDLGLQDAAIDFVQVDVTNKTELENAVQTTRVVINTVGPYWHWGTPVVEACAKIGVHYVDLTGEVPFLRRIIFRYDYLATKTGSIIVPSCGYDSIPSDVCAYLSNKTLKSLPTPLDVGSSMTSHRLKASVSGGTISTIITMLEAVPEKDVKDSMANYSASPVLGRQIPRWRFYYKVPVPGARPLIGAFFFLGPGNKAVVQRSYGLLELRARTTNSKEAQLARYGPDFAYDEFLAMPNIFTAVSYTLVCMTGFVLFLTLRPVRWFVQKFLPKLGEGPSEEAMQKGFMFSTNITTSTSEPPVHVKSVMKGNGDPGYFLTAIMASEAALALIFPPNSDVNNPEAARAALPLLAREGGGIFTPMTAFGDVLIKRLEDSGKFQFSSSVIEGDLKED